jgi:osmotically inducible protein OsmC
MKKEAYMIYRKSKAVWEGSIKEGKGVMEIGSGKVKMNYSFSSRFENSIGSNPEELLGAAHAGCFSMAFSLILGNAGFVPARIFTTADVGIDKEGEGFKIKSIKLYTEAKIPGISSEDFQKYALMAKKGCPVSVALASVPSIELEAKLV